MSHEDQVSMDDRRSFEEKKGERSASATTYAAENCSAKCPTCQQTCDYSAGHAGLHHCSKGHEWV